MAAEITPKKGTRHCCFGLFHLTNMSLDANEYARLNTFPTAQLNDDSIKRYKASLVAKGYDKKELDYNKAFALVAKLVTVRCLFVIASVR